jgi:uncharacterized membrane protein
MELTDTARLLAVGGALVTMLFGLWLIFQRLAAKEQGFGPNSLKAVGVVLFLPTIVILAVVVKDFEMQTVAALLGTVAGYILSHSRSDDK